MKVYLSNYRDHWLSPYTILEKVIFWKEIDYDSTYTKKIVNVLSPISEAVKKVLDIVHPRINYVQVDKYDTWNMDSTLANIILPMLIQLKATKHGVPSAFAETGGEVWKLQQSFEFYETNEELQDKAMAEWDAVLDKMIFSFEHIVDKSDWEKEFCSGEFDSNVELGEPGWTGTYICDYAAMEKVHEQIQEGLELFGKYYRNLWD
jgi:hypothetical protein